MFKVLENGKAPTKGSKYSAAVDLYASEDVVVGAGETVVVGLGVCIDIDDVISRLYTSDIEFKKQDFMRYHYLELHQRSSLRVKGLISNTGIIDLDYEDEIKIIVHNPLTIGIDSDYSFKHFKISKGDRIAQILLKEHKSYLFGIESEDERVGGFGSTGER